MRSIYSALLVSLLALAGVSSAQAAVTNGVGVGAFAGATLEKFDHGSWLQVNSYNFGNGLSYQNSIGQSDLVSYTSSYGMGFAPGISGGKDGDGYFGTYNTPTTFKFSFAGGASQFGFYGAESDVNEPGGRDALLTIRFFDASNTLIGTINEATPNSIHAWNQFHGFSSTNAFYSVEFVNAGHMVIDDLYFSSAAAVPEPETYAMLLAGLGLLGGVARRRKVQ